MDFKGALSCICMLRLFCILYYVFILHRFSLAVSFLEYNYFSRKPRSLLVSKGGDYITLPRLTGRRLHCENGTRWRTSGLISRYSTIKNRSEVATMLFGCSFLLPFSN
jgi:hypothetical protein